MFLVLAHVVAVIAETVGTVKSISSAAIHTTLVGKRPTISQCALMTMQNLMAFV
jgi:hypothetical protein